jgi:hypothetical protein
LVDAVFDRGTGEGDSGFSLGLCDLAPRPLHSGGIARRIIRVLTRYSRSDIRRVGRRSGAFATILLLVVTAVALAGVRFAPAAVYTGKSCSSISGLPGATCTMKFRASRDGKTLRYVGETAVSTWICKGGGGEALLGGKVKGATPVPELSVRSTRAIFGSTGTGGKRVTVTGRLAKGGRRAVITFHTGGPSDCRIPNLTLRER